MSYRDNFKSIDWSDLPTVIKERPPQHRGERSDLPGPMVISDVMPETQSMANGKFYSSKSAMRHAQRALGFYEVGNDKREPFRRPKVKRAEIKESLEKAKARVARGERSQPK